MKKLAVVLICLMMVLSLFSCRTSDQKDEDPVNTPTDPSPASNDVALQMYEAAIRDEICVFDERLGETKLKSLRFPSNNKMLAEYKLLTKAILDMDQDGINEYVIKSPNNDHIILHYYNGKVYSYCFDIGDFCNLRTDGTFYWNDFSAEGNWEGGLNKIIFDGATLNIKSICGLKYFENSVVNYYESDYYEHYINGEAVTRSEYLDFYTRKTSMTFTPFEPTCSYPITAEQAWNLANAYWNNADGSNEGAVGTLVVYKVVLLDTPNSDTNDYRIALQAEFFSNHDIRKDYNPPKEIRLYEQLLVNAFTGEVREYVEPEVDGKG